MNTTREQFATFVMAKVNEGTITMEAAQHVLGLPDAILDPALLAMTEEHFLFVWASLLADNPPADSVPLLLPPSVLRTLMEQSRNSNVVALATLPDDALAAIFADVLASKKLHRTIANLMEFHS